MSLRMERPAQGEEERKEEPEPVKTGDTWTGPRSALRLRSVDLFSMERVPRPVHRDIDLEKADQRRSETRRTEFSDQDKEEWEEEPESGRAGDTGTGPRSASSKPLLMGEDDIDNDTADQHRSETRRTESSGWGGGPFSRYISASWMGRERPTADHEDFCDLPHQGRTRESESRMSALEYFCNMLRTIASGMGRERPLAHRKDNSDFPDQPRTSKSETQRRKLAPEYACNVFGTWSAAAVWTMMALTVATSSLAGAVCIGTEVELDKGEAALRCPLPVDASATRQGIIIKHFPTPDSADEVMHCDWPTEEADNPKCLSSDGFSLVAPLTDQVVATVPVSRLMDSGAYKCQLYPLGDHHYFNPCQIHHLSGNDEGKHPDVVTTNQVPSTAGNHSAPGQDPLIMKAPPCVGQSDSVALTEAVLALQVVIIILLVVNVLCLQNKKNLQGKDGCMKVWMAWCPWTCSEKKPATPEGAPMRSNPGV